MRYASVIRHYYELTKPRLTYGNVFSGIASFLFASHWHVLAPAFPAFVVGLAFVVGGACVLNNYQDRDMDAKMLRTKERALVTGTVSPNGARAFGIILATLGFIMLRSWTNGAATLVAFAGFLIYVFPYTAAKRESSAAAIIGSFAGATPILAGYVAGGGQDAYIAFFLFLALALWQIPHFYAIATYRAEEYAAAGIPTVPAVRGARWTRYSILSYLIAYLIAVALLVPRAGIWFAVIAGGTGLAWLWQAAQGFRSMNQGAGAHAWARRTFRFSLLALLGFCCAVALASLLP